MLGHEHRLTQPAALAISICFALAYVAPFYLAKRLRISQQVSRNSPSSIRDRSRAVFLACAASFAVACNVQAVLGKSSWTETIRRMGIYPAQLVDVTKCLLLLCVLFIGPLFEQLLVDGDWRRFGWQSFRHCMYDDWIGWRNYVVGPVSEEVLFRSINVSLFLCAETPGSTIVLYTPLLFGVAHLHHLNEFIITRKPPSQSYLSAALTPSIIIPGLITTLFQLGFTTLFGMFVTFVFLRTGNVWACIVAHTFCNYMGLPRVWGRVGPAREDDGQSSDSARLGILWTVAYYTLLVAGAVGFKGLLYPLTESDYALTPI